MSGQLHALVDLIPGEQPAVPNRQRVDGLHSRSSLPPPGIESNSPFCNQSLY